MKSQRTTMLLAAVAVTLCMLLAVPRAQAVSGAAPTTTLSATYTNAANVTYTFAGYTLAGNQKCTGVRLVFPANTNVAGATAISPAGTVTVTGQTVTVTFTTAIPKASAVSVSLGGITNPGSAVTQTAGSMTFYLAKQNGTALPSETLGTGTYSVVPPYLTLSVSPASVHFDLTPEVTAPPQDITLTVDSSHPVTVSRDLTGDASLIGLSISGAASGSYPAGASSLVDQLSADVPWTTEGGLDYAATVMYTVVQQ